MYAKDTFYEGEPEMCDETTAAQPSLPKGQQLEHQDKALAVLSQTVDDLEVQLDMVLGLSQQPGENLATPKAPQDIDLRSSLVKTLQGHNERIYRINSRLRELTERIEI